jgi:hypothetical protein
MRNNMHIKYLIGKERNAETKRGRKKNMQELGLIIQWSRFEYVTNVLPITMGT